MVLPPLLLCLHTSCSVRAVCLCPAASGQVPELRGWKGTHACSALLHCDDDDDDDDDASLCWLRRLGAVLPLLAVVILLLELLLLLASVAPALGSGPLTRDTNGQPRAVSLTTSTAVMTKNELSSCVSPWLLLCLHPGYPGMRPRSLAPPPLAHSLNSPHQTQLLSPPNLPPEYVTLCAP
eukprot:1764687-Rhodomonas_salina.2